MRCSGLRKWVKEEEVRDVVIEGVAHLMKEPRDGETLDAHTVLSQRRGGDRLELRREPDNLYDPNTVSVWWGKTKLGHIPQDRAPLVARVLDEGLPWSATVAGKPPNIEVTWELRKKEETDVEDLLA